MSVRVFLALLASCLLASVLHEATHYVVAWACGRRPWFELGAWAVFWQAPPQAPTRADYAVAVAPVVLGATVGAMSAALWGVAWWLGPAWYLYTLHGAITNDLEFNPQTDTGAV